MFKLALSGLLAIVFAAPLVTSPRPANGPTAVTPAEWEWRTLPATDAGEGGGGLDYALVLPADYDPDRTYPVLLALPPGPQTKAMVERGLELYFAELARARGWIVVSPAAPEGTTFMQGAEERLVALMDAVEAAFGVEHGGFHLAGVSNGGRAAFRIAGLAPGRFLSLTVAPGMPPADEDWERLARVAHLPIALHVGAADGDWVTETRRTAERFRQLGSADLIVREHADQEHVLLPELAVELFERWEELRDGWKQADEARHDVSLVLDQLHAAAAGADEDVYFGLFVPEAIFIGTDATERWTIAQFRAYAEPHFQGESAWTYELLERHVEIGVDGSTAWFDERLQNERYGETRGSGVLVRRGGRWRIAHYVLSFAIPNEAAGEVVEAVSRKR